MSVATTSLKMSDLEFDMNQIKTDVGVSEQAYKYLIKLAKEWGCDVTNIAWLGGKPYPMQGSLYQQLQRKCEKEGLVVTGIVTKHIVRAEVSSKRAGFECNITLFDQRTFDELMSKSSMEKISVEAIREMRQMLTHPYHEEGWASVESVRMTTLHNADYLNHMGATRAIDRTLRIIVRCPFTAASELPDGTPGELGFGDPQAEAAEAPLVKPGQPAVVAETKLVESAAKPKDAASGPPTAKPISQKPINKIEVKPDPKKEAKLTEKQIDLALLQWDSYCKSGCLGIDKKQIDGKRARLLRALFGKDRIAELSLGQLEEWVGMMTRKEIEVTLDQPTDAPVSTLQDKPEIKT